MKKVNKLLSTVVVSSALITTVTVATSSSANNIRNVNNADMQLGITANNGGKSAKLSVHNVNMTNAFDLNIKIEGDVEFKNLEFSDYINQNAITKVNYNENSKVLNIVVTSDVDLAKGGVLEIGNIVVDGANDVEYKILDNSGITIVTPIYDEICDKDLEEIGNTQITIGATIQPPVEDEGDAEQNPQEPPVNGDDTTNPPTEEPPISGDDITTPEQPDVPEGDNGDNTTPEKPPVDEDISAPTEDIEVTEGKDGYKVITPKTEDALKAVINAILGADSDAKIVDVKEEPSCYIYRVKYKKVTKSDSNYGYIDIKVSKDIRAEQGLPGIETEKPNDQKPENDTTQKPENNNNGSTGGSNNSTGGSSSGGEATKPNGGSAGSVNNNSSSSNGNNNAGSNNSNTGNTGSSSNGSTNNPQTGDDSLSTIIISSILGISSIVGLIFVNKKKDKKLNNVDDNN